MARLMVLFNDKCLVFRCLFRALLVNIGLFDHQFGDNSVFGDFLLLP